MTPTQSLPWTDAVQRVSAIAQAKLPESLHGRLQRATGLVLDGAVFVEEDGVTTHVRCATGQGWYPVNGHCVCADAPRAEDGYCKHRLAKALYRRASELVREGVPTIAEATDGAVTPAAPRALTIPREFLTTIHGRDFVQFAGLLAMAHAQGLVSLTAELVLVTTDLALARATATFADGRTFTEAADATPDNVNAGVRKHFARCALTRAKSRALRDALNITMVAVDELE
jgi:hypothetical protein